MNTKGGGVWEQVTSTIYREELPVVYRGTEGGVEGCEILGTALSVAKHCICLSRWIYGVQNGYSRLVAV